MRKLLTLNALVIIASLTAGIYGSLHDQITYTISPEYYTKFKFIQFDFVVMGNEAILPNPRLYVAFVGFLATWWMGTILGFILSLVNLIQPDWKTMLTVAIRAFFVTMLVAFTTGIIGLIYGHFFLAKNPKDAFENWFIPNNVIDFTNYISVGSMHNFSYLGGVIGLVAGIIYSLRQKQERSELATF
ncbi:hypothetical protein JAO73_11035 [Hymenobacter sp. BT523]|uniref:hypothetical protein n=1 Tax=Hymenobacter sp. BT523 TaxID=2795725 RepID=UPI0018ECEF41|nr:hypothetical protein [Hymenobacter sp. BT523]MBJ6109550.1 hypothetical protein [Hymenobacter sp. BT523]